MHFPVEALAAGESNGAPALPVSTPKAANLAPNPKPNSPSPMQALTDLWSASELVLKTLRALLREGKDRHGDLQVIKSALQRALKAVDVLIESEEEPKNACY